MDVTAMGGVKSDVKTTLFNGSISTDHIYNKSLRVSSDSVINLWAYNTEKVSVGPITHVKFLWGGR